MRIWAAAASASSVRPWPTLTFHRLAVPSRYRRPSSSGHMDALAADERELARAGRVHVGERMPEVGVGGRHEFKLADRSRPECHKLGTGLCSRTGGIGARPRRERAPTPPPSAPRRSGRARSSSVLAAISSSRRSTGVGSCRDPVRVVGGVAAAARTAAPPRRHSTVSGPAVWETAVTPAGGERADLRLRVEARAVDVAVAAAVAHWSRRPRAAPPAARRAAPASTGRRRSSGRGRGRPARRGTCTACRPAAGWTRKCRSSKQISEPSSTAGSTAPQTVTASTPSAPSSLQRREVGLVGDVVGEAQVALLVARDVQRPRRPRSVPRETNASPHIVAHRLRPAALEAGSE